MPGPSVTRHVDGDKNHLPGGCRDSQRGPYVDATAPSEAPSLQLPAMGCSTASECVSEPVRGHVI